MRSVSTWFHSTNDDRADDGVLVLGHLVQISVVITVFFVFSLFYCQNFAFKLPRLDPRVRHRDLWCRGYMAWSHRSWRQGITP